jgi:hypothetical protein
MDLDAFPIAVERARLIYAPGEWDLLSFTEQSAAIYRELRALDATDAASRITRMPGQTKPHSPSVPPASPAAPPTGSASA